VTDNGQGPPLDERTVRSGHGHNNLMSRAASYGGSCELLPADGHGAVLRWTARY
jgi:signal transduction histidine kinase